MVKKALAAQADCRKCAEAESLLRSRGLWSRIDKVLTVRDGDGPETAGVRLAAQHGVTTAPFFVVEKEDGEATLFRSVLQFMRWLGSVPAPERPYTPHDETLDHVAARHAASSPLDIVRWGLTRFGEGCGIAFSGAEDVALIDMASRTGLPFSVFCLDTGRLHSETYQFIDRVRRHYGVDIRMMSPAAEELEPFVRKKGLFSFYEDGHQECCAVRKVRPLRRALSELDAWISGQRQDQNPATRTHLPVIQEDSAFSGRGPRLVKLNPLSTWTSAQTWAYLREHDVPFNALHERGFASIGCEPCTRPTHPGQHEREGRWWWEDQTAKECGLHSPRRDAAE